MSNTEQTDQQLTPRGMVFDGVAVSFERDTGFRFRLLSENALEPPEALALAEWLRTRAHQELDRRKVLSWREERRIKREEKRDEIELPMRRFWCAFSVTGASPISTDQLRLWPFPIWVVGAEFFTLVDARVMNPKGLLEATFGDAVRFRFSVEKNLDWTPDESRFPTSGKQNGATK
jgi:hypothetical protein